MPSETLNGMSSETVLHRVKMFHPSSIPEENLKVQPCLKEMKAQELYQSIFRQ